MQCAIYKQMKVWTLFSSLCCSSSPCPAPGPRRTPAATSWGPCRGRWGSAPPTRTAASSWLRRTTFKERVPQFWHWSFLAATTSKAPFFAPAYIWAKMSCFALYPAPAGYRSLIILATESCHQMSKAVVAAFQKCQYLNWGPLLKECAAMACVTSCPCSTESTGGVMMTGTASATTSVPSTHRSSPASATRASVMRIYLQKFDIIVNMNSIDHKIYTCF